jgi:hypothetical protein
MITFCEISTVERIVVMFIITFIFPSIMFYLGWKWRDKSGKEDNK